MREAPLTSFNVRYEKEQSTGLFTRAIGDGLFSRIEFIQIDDICSFDGEITSEVDYKHVLLGKGGYAVYLNAIEYVDCYANRQQNK